MVSPAEFGLGSNATIRSGEGLNGPSKSGRGWVALITINGLVPI